MKTTLMRATRNGDVENIKSILNNIESINIDEQDYVGRTALMVASYKGYSEIVELLIGAGANVNIFMSYVGETALMYAAQKGHSEIAKILIDAHADVNFGDEHGDTALMYACMEGHTEIVRLLLQANVDVNAEGIGNRIALMYASKYGYAEIVKLLLEHGAISKINIKQFGSTALMRSAKRGHTEVVKILLEAGANTNIRDCGGETALIKAARYGHADIAKLLVNNNAHIDVESEHLEFFKNIILGNTKEVARLIELGADTQAKMHNYRTPFMLACSLGHSDIAKIFIDNDADINTSDRSRETSEENSKNVLMTACNNGHYDVAKLLLEHGARINTNGDDEDFLKAIILGKTDEVRDFIKNGANVEATENSCRYSALRFAIMFSHVEITKLLIEAGANIHTNVDDKTLLELAVHQTNTEIVKFLIDAGIGVNIKNSHDSTALSYALGEWQCQDICKLLIEAGADIHSPLKYESKTPLIEISNDDNYVDIVKILIDKDVDVNAKSKDGETALMEASYYGHIEIVQMLIEANAGINAKNNLGNTVLMRACFGSNPQIVKLLLENGANVHIQNNRGETALIESITHCSDEDTEAVCKIINMLIHAGANVNTQNGEGSTVLMEACKFMERAKVIEILISAGIDVNIKNNDGQTALSIAKKNWYTDIIDILINAGAVE